VWDYPIQQKTPAKHAYLQDFLRRDNHTLSRCRSVFARVAAPLQREKVDEIIGIPGELPQDPPRPIFGIEREILALSGIKHTRTELATACNGARY
jgi:hypothetical protein